MTTATEARREYLARREHRRTEFEAEIEARGCPDCGHDSYVVTQAYPATRVDPACWEGHCTCYDMVGVCDDNCIEGEDEELCQDCCPCRYED